MKLYLVRHGETDWNKEMRYQGQTNVPLSRVGIIQSELIAERLKAIKFSAIYSSDLIRTFKTAKIIAKYGNYKIKRSKLIREINYGVFEGMLLKDVKEKYSDLLKRWWENPLNAEIPSGEPVKNFIERVEKFIKNTILSYKRGNILVVSHGGPIRIMIIKLLNLHSQTFRNFRQDNAALNIIEFNGGNATLTLMNDTCHLKRGKIYGKDNY